MQKYTIISYNFNGYDKLREPLIKSNNAELTYITDHYIKSNNWTVCVDERIVNKFVIIHLIIQTIIL